MTTATMSAPKTESAMRVWGGRVATALPILALTMSGLMKLAHAAPMVEKWQSHFGFSEGQMTPIGILELLVMITYAVPKTRILGAILVTAYFGGATVTHVRVGDPFLIPPILGALAWLGVWLKDERLRTLIPLWK